MLKVVLILLLQLIIVHKAAAAHNEDGWVIYYDDQASIEAFSPYKLLIFDSENHPLLRPLDDREKVLIGSIDLLSIDKARKFYHAVKEDGLIIPHSSVIDIRNPKWATWVLRRIIPSILHEEFKGIAIHGISEVIALERSDPENYQGLIMAMVELINAIKFHFPDIIIVVKDGLDIVPDIAHSIDYVLMHSLLTEYDRVTGRYKRVNNVLHQSTAKKIRELSHNYPAIRFLGLEYWDPTDKETIATLYELQQSMGLMPYVTTHSLKDIVNINHPYAEGER